MSPDRDLIERIYRIALQSRAWAEAEAIATGRDPVTLRDMCVKAAFDLFKRLQAAGLKPLFAKSRHHAFCLVDGLIVDVTGTQFANCDPVNGVWIADLSDEDDHGVWTVEDQAGSVEEILDLPCWRNWDTCDLPFPVTRR